VIGGMALENILEADLDHILHNTGDLWEEFRGKRIFITGGTGFFGCWLLESFVWANVTFELNASALVLTRNPEAFRRKAPHLYSNPSLDFHIGDVCNFEFPRGVFSHVIHAASGPDTTSVVHEALSLFDGIVKGTRTVLEFAARCNAEKFLFTSSGAVYGKQLPELSRIPEDYRGAPRTTDLSSAYGEGKRVSEFLSAVYAERYGFEAKIARCFAFVGPYLPLRSNFAIGNFIENVLNNEPVLVRGDGTPYRSYLYAADLTVWLWTILIRGKAGRPYNVGSAREFTIAEIARTVACFLNDRQEVQILEKSASKRPAAHYVPSVLRAEAELDLKQNIDLREAISRTISWFRKKR
jgi:nucleoside-diphosphate-sugar epimerase